MGFIWFFFMIFTMGSASRFSEYIENKNFKIHYSVDILYCYGYNFLCNIS